MTMNEATQILLLQVCAKSDLTQKKIKHSYLVIKDLSWKFENNIYYQKKFEESDTKLTRTNFFSKTLICSQL